jgi:tRNA 2-thiouridine synthesizing protein A
MAKQERIVDARGLACPIPVIRVKKALDDTSSAPVVVLIDDAVAKENVSRLVTHMGCTQHCEPCEDGFKITINKPHNPGAQL